jgi:nitroreductase
MNVSEAISKMRAVRHFTDQPVPEEAIRAILNAGRRAQSSKNTQPWQFVAVRDKHTLKQLSECGAYAGHLAGAAFAVALISPNPTGFDLGQATAFMQLQAWELGVGSCIASIYEPERAKASSFKFHSTRLSQILPELTVLFGNFGDREGNLTDATRTETPSPLERRRTGERRDHHGCLGSGEGVCRPSR